MTCKDCIHYEACNDHKCYDIGNREDVEAACKNFKDESKYIELPCKVGDTVYVPWVYDGAKGIACKEIDYIIFFSADIPSFLLKDFESDIEMPTRFIKEDISKTVFLTKKEAKAKLKELSK